MWLDLGCGTGHLAASLAGKGLRVIGADHDVEMGRFAAKRFQSAGRLSFLASKAESLPFLDQSLDGVVAVSLAGCLSSPDLFFKEMYRVLRPKGRAIITFTNEESLCLKTDAFFWRFLGSKKSDEKYRLYAFKEADEKLRQAGFAVRQVRYLNFFFNAGRFRIPPGRLVLSAERLSRTPMASRLARNFILLAERLL